MQYGLQKRYSVGQQLLILIGLLLAGVFFAGLIQQLFFLFLMPGKTSLTQLQSELPKILQDPANVQYVRIIQFISTFLMLFLPAFIFSRIVVGKSKFWLGFNRYIKLSQIALGVFIIFMANILASPLEDLSKMLTSYFPSLNSMARQLEENYNESIAAMGVIRSWPEFLLSILSMAFFPALFEEVFFRGVLQQAIARWIQKPILAIIIASAIFSLVHASVYLFFGRFILGLALGLTFYYTRNLWVNIFAHVLNNTIVLISMFFSNSDGKKIGNEELLNSSYEYWLAGASFFILIFLMKMIKKRSAENLKEIEEQEILLIKKQEDQYFI